MHEQDLKQIIAMEVLNEFYENVSNPQAQVTEQLYCNQNPPTDIGIYDNNSIIQQEQLRIIEEPILSPTNGGTNGVEAQ